MQEEKEAGSIQFMLIHTRSTAGKSECGCSFDPQQYCEVGTNEIPLLPPRAPRHVVRLFA